MDSLQQNSLADTIDMELIDSTSPAEQANTASSAPTHGLKRSSDDSEVNSSSKKSKVADLKVGEVDPKVGEVGKALKLYLTDSGETVDGEPTPTQREKGVEGLEGITHAVKVLLRKLYEHACTPLKSSLPPKKPPILAGLQGLLKENLEKLGIGVLRLNALYTAFSATLNFSASLAWITYNSALKLHRELNRAVQPEGTAALGPNTASGLVGGRVTTASNDSMENRTGRVTQGNGTYPVSADGCPYAADGPHKESYATTLWLHADRIVRKICRSLKIFELTFSMSSLFPFFFLDANLYHASASWAGRKTHSVNGEPGSLARVLSTVFCGAAASNLVQHIYGSKQFDEVKRSAQDWCNNKEHPDSSLYHYKFTKLVKDQIGAEALKLMSERLGRVVKTVDMEIEVLVFYLDANTVCLLVKTVHPSAVDDPFLLARYITQTSAARELAGQGPFTLEEATSIATKILDLQMPRSLHVKDQAASLFYKRFFNQLPMAVQAELLLVTGLGEDGSTPFDRLFSKKRSIASTGEHRFVLIEKGETEGDFKDRVNKINEEMERVFEVVKELSGGGVTLRTTGSVAVFVLNPPDLARPSFYKAAKYHLALNGTVGDKIIAAVGSCSLYLRLDRSLRGNHLLDCTDEALHQMVRLYLEACSRGGKAGGKAVSALKAFLTTVITKLGWTVKDLLKPDLKEDIFVKVLAAIQGSPGGSQFSRGKVASGFAALIGSCSGLQTAQARNQMAWWCSRALRADLCAAMMDDEEALDELKALHIAAFLSSLDEAPPGSPAAVNSKTQTPEQAAEGMWAYLLGITKAREYFYI